MDSLEIITYYEKTLNAKMLGKPIMSYVDPTKVGHATIVVGDTKIFFSDADESKPLSKRDLSIL